MPLMFEIKSAWTCMLILFCTVFKKTSLYSFEFGEALPLCDPIKGPKASAPVPDWDLDLHRENSVPVHSTALIRLSRTL